MYKLILIVVIKIIAIIIYLFLTNTEMGFALSSHENSMYQKIRYPSEYPLLKDIGGITEIKEKIIANIILPIKKIDKFFGKTKIKGLPLTRGTLFIGPPGTGKTLLANAIVNECKIPLLQIQLSDVENKYFGESNKLMKSVFKIAEKIMPCAIFFDEIDGLIRKRNEFDQACTYGMKTEFLQHLDLVQKKEIPILIIACTNHNSYLDPAIKRRIPSIYEINLPNKEERIEILTKLLQTSDGVEHIEYVAEKTQSFSGSDIYDLIQSTYSNRFTRKLKENTSLLNQDYPNLGKCIQEDWDKAILLKNK
jgi:ATPase family AAA domain-containing protein 1